MFRNYATSGPALLTDSADNLVGSFILEGTNTTIANTLRRCILTETRSVGFRADLTNQANPGVNIRKNSSAIFNEMLAHRITLIPLGVRRVDEFDPTRYECLLRVKNDRKGPVAEEAMLHVKAGDFVIREKQENGEFMDLGVAVSAAMFPADPLTKDTCLIVSLRPQWNPDQLPEELDLTAFPVVGRGRDHIGFCPVSQCSYANTPDTDPVRQERFFIEWIAAFKKVADITALTPEQLANARAEWATMAHQRCFLVDAQDQPNSFSFTVESVGIRPVPEIVVEGIRSAIELVRPYAAAGAAGANLGITIQPADSRMTGVDVAFAEQEHTLGNLLQTIIAEQTEAADSPISFVGYKVRHPLQRIMTLRIGIREGVAAAPDAIAMQAIGAAAAKAVAIFEELERSWIALTGLRSSSSSSSSGSSSGSSGSSSGSGSTASTT